DDLLGFLHRSPHFPALAQALGDFANTIDDLDVLEKVARLDKWETDKHGRPIYQILQGNAKSVFDNIAKAWGKTPQRLPGGGYLIKRYESVVTLYLSTGGSGLPTLMINKRGYIFKVRFGT
ncbi:MAG: hypothetical protein D6816_13120, partial [Bacteroidetes bacterium]